MSSHLTTDINGIQTGSRTLLLRQKALMDALQINLPGLAGNIRMVLSLCADISTGAYELSRALLKDYAITLTLIRQAHSAFFAVEKKEISSMRHIVVLLGMDNVTRIVLTCPRVPTEGPAAKHFRSTLLAYLMARSVLAGTLAWHIAPVWDEDPEKMAICAMLFSLDEVVLASVRPKAFKIIWELRYAPRNMQKLSKRLIGWKPGEMGVELARKWNLPRLIRLSVAFNRQSAANVDSSISLVAAVSVHLNKILFYAGLKRHRAGKKQLAEWSELRHLARGGEKRLERLFRKGLMDFKDENKFLSSIMWEHGLLGNILI